VYILLAYFIIITPMYINILLLYYLKSGAKEIK